MGACLIVLSARLGMGGGDTSRARGRGEGIPQFRRCPKDWGRHWRNGTGNTQQDVAFKRAVVELNFDFDARLANLILSTATTTSSFRPSEPQLSSSSCTTPSRTRTESVVVSQVANVTSDLNLPVHHKRPRG